MLPYCRHSHNLLQVFLLERRAEVKNCLADTRFFCSKLSPPRIGNDSGNDTGLIKKNIDRRFTALPIPLAGKSPESPDRWMS